MLHSVSQMLLLAEEAAAPQKNSDIIWVLLPPLAIIMLLYFMMDSPQRRERAKRDALIKNLKKDDRVVTIGGILGSVANVSQDGKEVTLKVDDGTRIRFRHTAIVEVLTDPAADVSKAAKTT